MIGVIGEFSFENTVKLTESQYVAIWGVLPTKPWFKRVRLLAITTVGSLFLLSTYTLLLGLILLVGAGLSVVLPRMIVPGGARSQYRRHRYLQDALTYGVSDQELWVKGARINARVQWSMLMVWREVEGWLLLSASGIPPVFLSIARLRERGLYDRVKDLAARHALEYDKRAPPRTE